MENKEGNETGIKLMRTCSFKGLYNIMNFDQFHSGLGAWGVLWS